MYFTQIDEIVAGRKGCTQRCEKPGEVAEYAPDGSIRLVRDVHGRVKWYVGGTYAVSAHRGLPTVQVLWPEGTRVAPVIVKNVQACGGVEFFRQRGYEPLRIRIKRIERLRLHTTTADVAVAEGVQAVAEYAALWRSINQRPGWRWEDNPMVWRLWFDLARG